MLLPSVSGRQACTISLAPSKRSSFVASVTKKASNSDYPIVLDLSDSDEKKEAQPKKSSHVAQKVKETIEIDLSDKDDDDEKKVEGSIRIDNVKTNTNRSSGNDTEEDVIDLT